MKNADNKNNRSQSAAYSSKAGKTLMAVVSAAGLIFGLMYARYLWIMTATRDASFGRMYDMFAGMMRIGNWPETIDGGGRFFVDPVIELTIIGPLTNAIILYPASQIFGAGWLAVFLCCMFLYVANVSGAFFILRTCEEKKVAFIAGLAAVILIVANPFFLLKITWDPLLNFGMLAIPLAYWLQSNGRFKGWAIVMITMAFYHPVSSMSAMAWLVWEIRFGGSEIKKIAKIALCCVAGYFVARAGFIFFDKMFYKEASWVYNTFGNATGHDLISVFVQGPKERFLEQLSINAKETLMVLSASCFCLCLSRKFFAILLIEFAYILIGIDASAAGTLTTFSGLMAVGIIDAYSGSGSVIGFFTKKKVFCSAAALLAVVFSIYMLIDIYRLVPWFSEPFYTRSLKIDAEEKKNIAAALEGINTSGTCVASPSIVGPVSKKCRDSFSLNSLFPYDISNRSHLPSRSDFELDWLLIAMDEFGEKSFGVSFSEQRASGMAKLVLDRVGEQDMSPIYFDGEYALLRRIDSNKALSHKELILKSRITKSLEEKVHILERRE